MENTEYGIIDAEPRNLLPETKLLIVPHKAGKLVVRYPAFGPNNYSANVLEMQKDHYHSVLFHKISFSPATTSESVSASAYKFGEMAKKEIFNPSWLQLGLIARTSEGVFANPPKDENGNPIFDEETLKSYLNGVKRIEGICLVPDTNNLHDFGFAPYETFKQGIQDSGDFAESGLARLLEHSEGKVAENLREISSQKFYRKGVNVFDFDQVKEPILRVAYLYSCRNSFVDNGFHINGGNSVYDRYGYAFGVRNVNAEGVVPKN